MNILTQVLASLIPPCCFVCHRSLANWSLCSRCLPSILSWERRCIHCGGEGTSTKDNICFSCILFPLPLKAIRFLWLFDNRSRAVLHVMKYEANSALTIKVSRLMGEHLRSLFSEERWDYIVPIPSSKRNFRTRLFNQAAVCAAEITRQNPTRGSLFLRLLKHTQQGTSQADLPTAERAQNAKKSFVINSSVEGKKILLIDDVITTGSTLMHCASLLKMKGAASVDAYTLAAAPKWKNTIGKRLRTTAH